MKTVLWLGPVSTSNISDVVPTTWQLKTYNHGAGGGIGSSAFREWARDLGNDPLSALAPGADEIILAGFSAAHGATEVILEKVVANNDRRLRRLLAVDSYHVSNGNTTPKPAHLAWLRQIIAARDGRKAWFTTSTTAGPDYLSSRDSFDMLAHNIGMELADARIVAPTMPEPYLCWQHGPVVWLNYEQQFKHTEHATKLAPLALKYWFDKPDAKPASGNNGFGSLALVGLLIAAYALSKSRSRW